MKVSSRHSLSRALGRTILGGSLLAILGTARLLAETPPLLQGSVPATTTPRRPLPENRFDFRGEHAGVIYTPQGWMVQGDGSDRGQVFVTPQGYPVVIPYTYTNGSTLSEPVALGSSYEIVDRRASAAVARRDSAQTAPPATGHYEVRAEEVPVEGQFVEVYHPAVFETDDQGRLQLVQPEETRRVPKTRVVLRRAWVDGPPPRNPPSKPKASNIPTR